MEDCVTISSWNRICQCQDYQQHCVSCRLKVYHYNLVCFKQIPLCSGGQTGSYPFTPFAKFYIFENNNWVEIGSFETPRRFNGLSVVDGTDVCSDSGQRQLITLNLTVYFHFGFSNTSWNKIFKWNWSNKTIFDYKLFSGKCMIV